MSFEGELERRQGDGFADFNWEPFLLVSGSMGKSAKVLSGEVAN